jgi:hypothetical protein
MGEENGSGRLGGKEMKSGAGDRKEKKGKFKWEAGRRGDEKGKGRQLICHLLNLI